MRNRPGRFEEAIAAYKEDPAICREIGDRYGEVTTLNHLGTAMHDERHLENAVTVHRGAAEIYREIGERHGEAKALNNLGAALEDLSQFEEAIAALQNAAALFGETGDRQGEGLSAHKAPVVHRWLRPAPASSRSSRSPIPPGSARPDGGSPSCSGAA